MLKKALIRSLIYEWLESKNLPLQRETIQKMFDNSKELFEYLKNHPDFGDLLPNIEYNQFLESVNNLSLKEEA